MRKIIFFSNSNPEVGEGHCIRCLRLLNSFPSSHYLFYWVSCSITDRVRTMIPDNIELSIISVDEAEVKLASICNGILSDIVIIDSYDIDISMLKRKISHKSIFVAFDDLANRYMPVDILIDGSPIRVASDYDGKINKETKLLVGKEFIILSNEYKNIPNGTNTNNCIHIFFGSTDKSGFTYQYLVLLLDLLPGYEFNVVVTRLTPNLREILNMENIHQNRVTVVNEPSSLKSSLQVCAYAVGAPGTTTWERIACGCTCLLVSTNKNQILIMESLAENKLIYYLGDGGKVEPNCQEIARAILSGDILTFNQIDGNGADRIVNEIEAVIC